MTADRPDLVRVAEALACAARGELLGPSHMAAIFGMGGHRFSVLNAAGHFDQFKVKPALGRRCFSGVLVHRYLSGGDLGVYVSTYGARRVR